LLKLPLSFVKICSSTGCSDANYNIWLNGKDGVEHNFWEYLENLNNAAEAVTEFHTKNPATPQHIQVDAFLKGG
jgi:hypothetical protein